MVEREIYVRPKTPAILTRPFNESVHPYTMMFLYLAYQEGAHSYLKDDLQRKLFDLYFTDGLTIEGQKEIGQKNLEFEIINGFQRLKAKVSDEVRKVFKDSMLPFFKEGDYLSLTDKPAEIKKRSIANRSISLKGKKRTGTALENIRKAHKKSKINPNFRKKMKKYWEDDKFKDAARERSRKIWDNSDYWDRMSEKRKALWQDDNYKEKTLTAQKEGRERKKQKEAEQQSKE